MNDTRTLRRVLPRIVAVLALLVGGGFASMTAPGAALETGPTAPAFTRTITASRTHLVDGEDSVVDNRSITVTVDQTQQVAFGVGDVEGFARGARVVAQAAPDAAENSGQVDAEASRRSDHQRHVYL